MFFAEDLAQAVARFEERIGDLEAENARLKAALAKS
jgi:uncharacterized small protein (DUF1192 family)